MGARCIVIELLYGLQLDSVRPGVLWTYQLDRGCDEMFSPREYVSMAQYVHSDIDLGNASAAELDALAVEAIAQGYGFIEVA